MGTKHAKGHRFPRKLKKNRKKVIEQIMKLAIECVMDAITIQQYIELTDALVNSIIAPKSGIKDGIPYRFD